MSVQADGPRIRLPRRLCLAGVELGAGAVVALGFTKLCMSIDVNPMQRVGQVSGLAGLQLRFIAVFVVLALLWWAFSRRLSRPLALRLACCSLAGLATGLYAGGVAVTLRGTALPPNGVLGDAGQLQLWVADIQNGRPISGVYPPLFPHLLTWWTELFHPDRPGAALKVLGLVLIALTGPAAYLAWRMLLPPLWSLGIGVVSVFPIVHAAKPYVDIVLIMLIPVLAKFMAGLLGARAMTTRTLLLTGAGYGLGLSALFLWYSGWFVWSAPGALAALALLLFRLGKEGRTPLLRAAAMLGTTAAVFLAVSGSYLVRLLGMAGTPDTYMYFDTFVDPAYFAMWQGDQPGQFATAVWPLPGELGGVGVFALLLVAGLGVALWLGPTLPVVQVAGLCMLGAFGLRYWFASHMERDQLVQLYPRTSAELLYCAIVLCGMAGYLVSQKLTGRSPLALIGGRKGPVPALRTSGAVLCALAFFFSMAGSATVDRFMPRQDGSWGTLTWVAQTTEQPGGGCPRYAPEGKCTPLREAWARR
ncbi:hypothetical protein [Kitasatospora purpeofusca]|uniref:hypothetical protein n=1 Tax=Kitasatospora purpeofusca TaxID=67352 RepID=UPI00224FA475|nr:hypothetical protein [Kitasatospora purpeofusca]MCX4753321.1 hypothetical protein [Kitasatospora purpeofusca]WSR32831.1 hypothetical protein OG715_18670 [Kitasatospora purpeofusca]